MYCVEVTHFEKVNDEDERSWKEMSAIYSVIKPGYLNLQRRPKENTQQSVNSAVQGLLRRLGKLPTY